jgi:hypothetical protein
MSSPELLVSYPFNEGEGSIRLGEEQIEYRSRSLLHSAFSQPVFFAFNHGRLSCITSDFWSLDPASSDATLRALGEPTDRIDAFFRNQQLPQADWIYADRGLALCVNPDTRLIARLQAYPPCPLAIYRQRLRPIGPAREFPIDREL